MKLTCDLCGGALQMNPDCQGAACTGCGMTYSLETLREKLNTNPAPVEEQVTPVDAAPVDAVPVTHWSAVRKLRIHRRFSTVIFKVAVWLDGEKAGFLGGPGSVTEFEVTEGVHTISFQIASTIGLTELEEQTFTVADRDIAGVFYFQRHAFSAEWKFEMQQT